MGESQVLIAMSRRCVSKMYLVCPLCAELMDCNGSPEPSGALKKRNGARRLPDPNVLAQQDDSERSHFVTSFTSLQPL